jgi:hypothetical protein
MFTPHHALLRIFELRTWVWVETYLDIGLSRFRHRWRVVCWGQIVCLGVNDTTDFLYTLNQDGRKSCPLSSHMNRELNRHAIRS